MSESLLHKVDQLIHLLTSNNPSTMASEDTDESKTSSTSLQFATLPSNHPTLELPKDNIMQYVTITPPKGPNKDPTLSLSNPNDVANDANAIIPSKLESGEVLIKVYATAVNRADLLQARGKYPPPKGVTNILGLECCGVIVACNNDCKRTELAKIGTFVMALVPGGSYAQYCKCHESTLIGLPTNITPNVGAAIPEAFLTAFQLLFKYGSASLINTEKNKNKLVLIHAAASGVGTALLQYCVLFGLNAFVTCGSDDKIKACIEKYGAVGGWNYKLKHDWKGRKFETFDAAILSTFPKGADIILGL